MQRAFDETSGGIDNLRTDTDGATTQSTPNQSPKSSKRDRAWFDLQPWRRRAWGVLWGILLLWGVSCWIHNLPLHAKAQARDDKRMYPSSCSYFVDDCETAASFIFDSVNSLLKQWPSTFAPNGHSIVTATVPPNTQLYHAKVWSGAPQKPTFFAFNP